MPRFWTKRQQCSTLAARQYHAYTAPKTTNLFERNERKETIRKRDPNYDLFINTSLGTLALEHQLWNYSFGFLAYEF